MPKGEKHAQRETRKQQVRRAREERQERLLFLALGGVALLVLIIFGLGVISSNYGGLDTLWAIQSNQPIAIVNGHPISIRDYQTQLRYSALNLNAQFQQATLNLQQIGNDPTLAFLKASYEQQQQQIVLQLVGLPNQMLETMIEDELVRQEAARRGITVTADEVDQEIEQYVGYLRPTPTPTAGPSPTPTKTGTPTRTPTITPTFTPSPQPTGTLTPTTPTATPTVGPTETPEPTPTLMSYQAYLDEKKKLFETITKNTQVSESAIRTMIETAILRRKLQKAFADEMPTTAEQVQARHILVKTYDDALKVQERLNKGEDFAKLAQELSEDTGSKEDGGNLGWFARGTMIKEFEDAAFALQPNQISQPVTTTFGVHLIQVTAREANRELDPSALARAQNNMLDEWLQKAAMDPNNKIERFYKEAYVPSEVKKILAQFSSPLPR